MDGTIRGLLRDVLNAEVAEIEKVVLQYTRLDLPASIEICRSIKTRASFSMAADPARAQFFFWRGSEIGCFDEDGYCHGWATFSMSYPRNFVVRANLLLVVDKAKLLCFDTSIWPTTIPSPKTLFSHKCVEYDSKILVDASTGNLALTGVEWNFDMDPCPQPWVVLCTRSGTLIHRFRNDHRLLLLAIVGAEIILGGNGNIQRRSLATGDIVAEQATTTTMVYPFGYDTVSNRVLAFDHQAMVRAYSIDATKDDVRLLAPTITGRSLSSMYYMEWSTGQRVLATSDGHTLFFQDAAIHT